MMQHNQVGKYRKKESILDARKGRIYITPLNNQYTFIDYKKHSNEYVFIIEYKGHLYHVREKDYMQYTQDCLLSKLIKYT
jgi:poly(3-hydroxyalkanoate) synthetase